MGGGERLTKEYIYNPMDTDNSVVNAWGWGWEQGGRG